MNKPILKHVKDRTPEDLRRVPDEFLWIQWEIGSYRAVEWYDPDDGLWFTSFHHRVLDHRTESGAPVHRWEVLSFADVYHHREIAQCLTNALSFEDGRLVLREHQYDIPVIDPWSDAPALFLTNGGQK